ncbi:hypothetical protein DXG01_012460 [Tephrocybe rancida]|nr:hypothetical protein DXG01_012460 [Tephrocybe rancida]
MCRCQTNKRVTNIIVNLESAAFHLCYLLEGHPDLPNSKEELLAYFARCLHAQEEDKNDWATIKIKDMNELRGPLFIAMSITPLVLLMGRNLQNRLPGMDALADYWQIMGQYQRPPSVQDAEQEVWPPTPNFSQNIALNHSQVPSTVAPCTGEPTPQPRPKPKPPKDKEPQPKPSKDRGPKPRKTKEPKDQEQKHEEVINEQGVDDQAHRISDSEDEVQYVGTSQVVKVTPIIYIDLTKDSMDEAMEEKKSYSCLKLHNGGPFEEDIHFMEELHCVCLRTEDLQVPSHVRRIPYDEYKEMMDKDVTDIFCDHSIVITNIDSKEMSFKEAMYSLKAIDEELVVIDQSIYEPDTPLHEDEGKGMRPSSPSEEQLHRKMFAQTISQHCVSTLRQVMDSVNSENPKSLNVLDIAVKSDKIPEQPLFSNKVAWDHTTAKAGENYPISDMRWALASSGWTQHRWHQDSNGFATVVTVQSGMKWWYIGSPRKGIDPSQDSGGILCFLDGFDQDESNSSHLDVEVMVLTPSDWLFLKPQTFHAVITPIPTVVNGGHFIASVTVCETCFGIYDDFIAGRFITNTEHHKASFTLLSHLLVLYHKSFLHPGPDDIMESIINHIPDVSPSAGVTDLFCFCHLFELYGVLCSWQYNMDDSVAAALSRRHVIKNRKLAQEIKEWFFCHHDLKVLNGVLTNPSHVWVMLDHKFLAQQCQALLTLKAKADQGLQGRYVVGKFTFKRDTLHKAIC